jgi:hypothetical protein
MPVPPCRRIPPGQRDGDSAPPPCGRHSSRGLGSDPRRIQGSRRSSLTGRCGAFDALQLGDALDERPLRASRVDRRE